MRKFSYIMLLLAVIILVLPGMAFAEEAAQVADAATSGGGMQNFAELVFGSGMVKWFKDGGWQCGLSLSLRFMVCLCDLEIHRPHPCQNKRERVYG